MIALRLNRRRDGSLCLTGRNGSASDPEREFPEVHFFKFSWLAANSGTAVMDSDTVKLELANARATYRVTGRRPDGVDLELVDSKLFDAPPLDEKAAEALAAARAVVESSSTTDEMIDRSAANAGSARVDEGG